MPSVIIISLRSLWRIISSISFRATLQSATIALKHHHHHANFSYDVTTKSVSTERSTVPIKSRDTLLLHVFFCEPSSSAQTYDNKYYRTDMQTDRR